MIERPNHAPACTTAPQDGTRRRLLGAALGAAATGFAAGRATPVLAQDGPWPNRPVRVIVPYAAGSGSDVLARALAGKLQDSFGRAFVVENRTGASGILGVEAVTRAPADGYTLLVTSGSALSINPAIFRKLSYRPETDLQPVSAIGIGHAGLLINAASPARTLPEFVDWARSVPGTLSYGSFGIGSGVHIALEALSRQAGLKMNHVPYRGTAPAVTDLLGGQIHLTISDLAGARQQIDAGRLRMLAVTGTRRSPLMPDVPTYAEAGYPGLTDTFARFGVLAPAGTPADIVDKLSAATVQAMRSPDLQQRYAPLGYELAGTTPAEFAEILRGDIQRWGKLVAELGGLSLEP